MRRDLSHSLWGHNLLESIIMKRNRVQSSSRLGVFLYRILVVFLFFLIFRFFYWFVNRDLLGTISSGEFWSIFKGGLLFDAAAIAYTNILFAFLFLIGAFLPLKAEMSKGFKTVVGVSYLIPNFLNIVANIADAAYYPIHLQRATYSMLKMPKGGSLFLSIGEWAIEFWPYTLTILALTLLLYWSYRRVSYVRPKRFAVSPAYKFFSLLMNLIQIAVITLLAIFAIKGSWQVDADLMTPERAKSYVKEQKKQQHLVLNSTFTIISSGRE